MAETPASLLERLRRQPDAQSWQQLVTLYTPLIQNWLRRAGLPATDADDLVQVLRVLVRNTRASPRFFVDGKTTGRYLRGIRLHCCVSGTVSRRAP